MAIYKRGGIDPEWEQMPLNMKRADADTQENGFHQRAMKPIQWRPILWLDPTSDGLFGETRNWLRSLDAEYYALHDGEDLLLISNVYSGWPDPPEWGLATRPTPETPTAGGWSHWGHFANLPKAWGMPAKKP